MPRKQRIVATKTVLHGKIFELWFLGIYIYSLMYNYSVIHLTCIWPGFGTRILYGVYGYRETGRHVEASLIVGDEFYVSLIIYPNSFHVGEQKGLCVLQLYIFSLVVDSGLICFETRIAQ